LIYLQKLLANGENNKPNINDDKYFEDKIFNNKCTRHKIEGPKEAELIGKIEPSIKEIIKKAE